MFKILILYNILIKYYMSSSTILKYNKTNILKEELFFIISIEKYIKFNNYYETKL